MRSPFSKTACALAALLLAAVIATTAWFLKGSAERPTLAEASSQGTAAPDARLDDGFTQSLDLRRGTRARYHFKLARGLTGTPEAEVSGNFHMTVVGIEGGEFILDFSFADIVISENDARTPAPFAVKAWISATGQPRALAFATPPTPDVLLLAQTVVDRSFAARLRGRLLKPGEWSAPVADARGIYLGFFHDLGVADGKRTLSLSRGRYLETGETAQGAEATGNGNAVLHAATNVPQTIDWQESVTFPSPEGGRMRESLRFQLRQETDWDVLPQTASSTTVASAVPDANAPARAGTQSLSPQTTFTFGKSAARRIGHEQWLATVAPHVKGLWAKYFMRRLDEYVKKGDEDMLFRLRDHLAALIELQPESAQELVEHVLGAEDGSRKQTLVLAALGGAGTPEAQRALLEIMRQGTQRPMLAQSALTQVILLDGPIADFDIVLWRMRAANDAPNLRRAAELAMGALAKATWAVEPERARKLMKVVLEVYDQASTPDEKRHALRVLGNAGWEGTPTLLSEELRSPEPGLRGLAYEALSFVVTDESDSLLVERLRTEPLPDLRGAILRALSLHTVSPRAMTLLEENFTNEKLPGLRLKMLEIILRCESDPQALGAFLTRAANDPDANLRERIRGVRR